MKKVRIQGKEYLELPGDLVGRKLLIVRLGESLYLVGEEGRVRELVLRQVRYLASRKREKRPEERRERYRPVDRGYWVFDSETEAADFSRKHAEEFQSGEIMGIRGFDGKYYAVRRSLYDALLPKVVEVVKTRPSTVEEIARELKKDKDLIKAILELAREEGIVVERVGGVYEYAG